MQYRRNIKTEVISFKVSADMLEIIDTNVYRINKRTGGRLSRSDWIRMAIIEKSKKYKRKGK